MRLVRAATLWLAPGTYAVRPANVVTSSRTYVPNTVSRKYAVGAGALRTATARYGTIIPSSTKPLAAAAVESAAGDPGGQQTLTLAAAAARGLRVGDVLVLGVTPATPEGLLGRVERKAPQGAAVKVVTTPATLLDAIERADVDEEIPIAIGDHAGGLARRVARASGVIPISRNLKCSGGGSATVSGSFSITPTIHFTAKWAFLHVSSAALSADLTETADLRASARAAAGCSLGETPLLPKPLVLTSTFAIGPVPVVLVTQVQVVLSASGRVTAAVATRVSQTITASAGIRYAGGLFSPIATLRNGWTYEPPSPTSAATASASVGPRFTFLLYGVAGPSIAVDAGLDLNADLAKTPWWTLSARIHGAGALRVPALGLSSPSLTIFDWRKIIAQATTPPPSQPPPAKISPGQLDGLLVRVTVPIGSLNGGGFCQGQTAKMMYYGYPAALVILRQPSSGTAVAPDVARVSAAGGAGVTLNTDGRVFEWDFWMPLLVNGSSSVIGAFRDLAGEGGCYSTYGLDDVFPGLAGVSVLNGAIPIIGSSCAKVANHSGEPWTILIAIGPCDLRVRAQASS
jgi:hypothetical protein